MSKTYITGAIVGIGALLLSAMPAFAQNIVVNGSFEEPVVNTPQQWDIFLAAAVPGWSVSWMPGSGNAQPAEMELHRGVNNWAPQEGEQYTELDSDWDGPGGNINNEAASVRISQDLDTEARCTYELSFWFSPRPGTPEADNKLGVTWNGTDVAEVSTDGSNNNNTVWTEYTYNVVGTGNDTLAFEDRGTANSQGTFLDNVSVEKVSCPEPEPEPCDCGDVTVNTSNSAVVRNNVTTKANTGGNVSTGGNARVTIGGFFRKIRPTLNLNIQVNNEEEEDGPQRPLWRGGDNDNNDARGGNTGDIDTGNAVSTSVITNVVNSTEVRVRTRR